MAFLLKPDYDKSLQRFEAFWHGEIVDRPPVNIVLPVDKPTPIRDKTYATMMEKWLDVDYRAEAMANRLANHVYPADGLPIAFPNMGPEIFSAWCGCAYEYGADTTWSNPCISDWDNDAPHAVLDLHHPLFIKTVEFTERLLEYGAGNFIVGLTDFHPGGDHLAALRDPQNLAMDLLEHPEEVKRKLESSYKEYYQVYDIFYELLRRHNMPITSWLTLIHPGKYYIPSNDFSCMISNHMFNEFFLPGLIEECRFYDRSIYHLDGPNALRHLDCLLDIQELDAIQWVCGAGNEGYHQWIPVYKKIQSKKKGLALYITLDELPMVFETLRPEGVWFAEISGIQDQDTADRVLKRIEKWS